MGGISLTFLVVDKIVDEFSVGGISLTRGGYITHTWGVYHSHLGGISLTKVSGNPLFSYPFAEPKLYLNLY